MTRATSLVRTPRIDPGIAALVAAMVIWGVTMVITKSVLEEVGPFTLLAGRFALAFALLGPVAARRGFRLSMVIRPTFIAFGITGIVLHNGLETVGLMFTSAGSGALVIAAAPALTAALSVVFLKESVTRLQIAGIVLSILGVAMVTNAGIGGVGSTEILGNLLVFGGVISWAVYTVQGKRLVVDLPAIVTTTAGIGAATMILIPMAITEVAVTGVPSVSMSGFLGIVYLGALASALAYALWNSALNHVDASVAAPYVNLVPVIGLLAALLIGEPTNAMQLAGGAVVGLGIWLSEAGRVRRDREARLPAEMAV
ncbi:MAG: DMT family transporter [Actinomycetota bacterium]